MLCLIIAGEQIINKIMTFESNHLVMQPLLSFFCGLTRTNSSVLRALFAAFTAALAISSAHVAHASTQLNGAGSTAAAPVYNLWATARARSHAFTLSYDAVGSSAGIKKFQAKEVSFGASDVAISQAELDKNGWVMAPTFVTAAVPVVNLPKVGSNKIRLSGEVMAGIFSGEIARWNAAPITTLNPDLPLPDLAIKPIVRGDGSGTTYYFTEFLSASNAGWKAKYGAKSSIAWPAGFSQAQGAPAIAKLVKETVGAISYLDLTTASESGVSQVLVRNAANAFVAANAQSVNAAMTRSEWFTKNNFQASLINQEGVASWPIPMATFIYLPKITQTPAETQLALDFFVWALLRGDAALEGSSFVRLPDKLQGTVFKALSSVTDKSGRPMGMEALSRNAK
jgi:phosphate transport system substrate-binding protein